MKTNIPNLMAVTLAVISTITVSHSSHAQTYKWSDGLCDYQGDFDNKKYTAQQIKNSYYILNQLTSMNLEVLDKPRNMSELDALSIKNLDTLDIEYTQLKNKINNLSVVPEAESEKQELFKVIAGQYTIKKMVLLAYIDPAEAIKQSPNACRHYIKPLLQTESAVQNKWKEAVEENIQEQSQFGDDHAEFYRRITTQRYETQKADDPYFYARSHLISFSFNNCVVHQVYQADSDRVFANFEKLNKILFGNSFKEMCEMP